VDENVSIEATVSGIAVHGVPVMKQEKQSAG